MGSYLFSFFEGKGWIKAKLRARILMGAPRSPYVLSRAKKGPGSRIKTEFGHLLSLPQGQEPVLVDYAIERHVTPRNQNKPMTPTEVAAISAKSGARAHFDLRFRDPATGEVHAFALAKGFPSKGERFMIIKVDDRHGHETLINKGIPISRGRVLISEGYGRGHSKLLASGKAIVWSGSGDSIHIWIPPVVIDGERVGGEFSIVKPKDWVGKSQYLLQAAKKVNMPVRERPFDVKDISGDQAELEKYINSDCIAEWKKDGAFYTVELKNGTVISRRVGVDGHGIDRSMRLLHIKGAKYPDYAFGLKIRVEVHSEVKGQWKSQHGRTGAIMTMDPASALAEQQKHGRLRLCIIGIDDVGDYRAQRALAKQLTKDVTYTDPSTGTVIHPFSVAPASLTPKGKAVFVKSLKEKGAEGVVFKDMDEPNKVVKFVFRGKTEDVKIVGVEPMITAQPKYMRDGKVIAAQVFLLEDGRRVIIRDPEGGPGSTDKLKLDVGANPDKYIGAYVETQSRQANRSSTAQIHRLRLDK